MRHNRAGNRVKKTGFLDLKRMKFHTPEAAWSALIPSLTPCADSF